MIAILNNIYSYVTTFLSLFWQNFLDYGAQWGLWYLQKLVELICWIVYPLAMVIYYLLPDLSGSSNSFGYALGTLFQYFVYADRWVPVGYAMGLMLTYFTIALGYWFANFLLRIVWR